MSCKAHAFHGTRAAFPSGNQFVRLDVDDFGVSGQRTYPFGGGLADNDPEPLWPRWVVSGPAAFRLLWPLTGVPSRSTAKYVRLVRSAYGGAMQMIGLIGGMSWESSAEYYRILTQAIRDRLAPTVSARSLLWSFDFSEIEELQHNGDWDALTARMIDAAQRLEAGGADVLLICTNTMHRMAPAVQAAVKVPLLHIADPTAERIKAAGFKKIGLLGTAFTMEHDFYKGRLAQQHGLNVIVPNDEDRITVHRVIYEELVAGKALPVSRDAFRAIIARMVEAGAEAVILGCTEIMLLVRPDDSPVPIFDTTALHATAAIEMALAG